MKIRSGFVSNSSSSSFAVYGVDIQEGVLVKLAQSLLSETKPELVERYAKYVADVDENGYHNYDNEDYQEVICSVACALGSGWEGQAYTYEEPDHFYLGRCPSDIDDNETGKQFRDSVQDICDKHKLGDPSYMSDTIYG